MEKIEIENIVKSFLIGELEIEPENVRPDSRLKEDMGIDSLEIVDVVVLVDEKFGFRMKAEDFRQIATMDDFCSFIFSRISK